MDQKLHSINDSELSFASPTCAPPICRQFWNAGTYDNGVTPKSNLLRGGSHLHVHPKFLHTNATSHKWAFGAIAELLDNSVDEIANGATYAIVDKIKNPRDGSAALLVQDDGGGMDPDAMRCCLSFGFSDKKSTSIGKYGNGFKTSSMRLGADVIVFSRHLKDRKKLTQSIGLLSYTFLSQTGHDRIVVPMVDYEINMSTGSLEMLQPLGKENFTLNLSMLMQWSPYSTEVELMKQFEDIGYHGTKIVIYNLWFNDENILELNFDSNPEDICLHTEAKSAQKVHGRMTTTEQHIATQFQYSLRVYLSILYMKISENFSIILRGRPVEFHNIARDLKFPEYIVYKPNKGGIMEGEVLTSIGFLKEAPNVNINGFSVYHKNRLILPFWRVLNTFNGVGRGVVGVLEANFIEPTHNKQDFERTQLFQKLEQRLKDMAREYWDYHCGLIGYHQKKTRPSDLVTPSSNCARELQPNLQGGHIKRKEQNSLTGNKKEKNVIDIVSDIEIQPSMNIVDNIQSQKALDLMQVKKKLGQRYLDAQKREEQLNLKLKQVEGELALAQSQYDLLVAEVQLVDEVKRESYHGLTAVSLLAINSSLKPLCCCCLIFKGFILIHSGILVIAARVAKASANRFWLLGAWTKLWRRFVSCRSRNPSKKMATPRDSCCCHWEMAFCSFFQRLSMTKSGESTVRSSRNRYQIQAGSSLCNLSGWIVPKIPQPHTIFAAKTDKKVLFFPFSNKTVLQLNKFFKFGPLGKRASKLVLFHKIDIFYIFMKYFKNI